MIIAEFCQNHLGQKTLLKEMIVKAAYAGAHACKIQSFFADDLTPEFDKDYSRIKQCELDWPTHAWFVKEVTSKNMTPMTTVYSTKYLRELHESGFTWLKIGSPNYSPIFLQTLKALGFKVIASTGGKTLNELWPIYPMEGLLHCVSVYPHTPEDSCLMRMVRMMDKFKCPVGFSDHTDPLNADWDVPVKLALLLGATVIEKHFTLLPRNETKDGPVSIDADQLRHIREFFDSSQERRLHTFYELNKTISPRYFIEDDTVQDSAKKLIDRYSKRWIST